MYDYIIIGSGFGGSVSALRLAEKGYSVLVLERGKRHAPKDFPKTSWEVSKFLWLPPLRLYGIQALTVLSDVFVLHGVGVGGGSLVYANTLLEPPDRFFQDPRWAAMRDWKAELMPFYRVAKRMLGAVRAPEGAVSDEILRECARDMGREHTFHRPTVAVYLGEPGKTVPDPFFGGMGPERTGCIQCGGCMVGCRYDSKNTLDKNYLYLAEKLGANVLPERWVQDVRPLPGGGYEVTATKTGAWFSPDPQRYQARNVVFSGGVMGTVDLLLRLKESGSLPKLSEQLGNYVRTNSEAILAVTTQEDGEDLNAGIAISAGFHPDEDTHVETVRYNRGSDFMSFLTTILTPGSESLPRWVHFLGAALRNPLQVLKLMWPPKWAERTVIILVMQPVNNYLRLKRKRSWVWPFSKVMDSDKGDTPGVPTYIPIANQVTQWFARRMRAIPQSGVIEVALGVSNTAHILGGCPIGRDASDGVIAENHEVFNYPGMFVVDGSAIPANLGVNPSLTITAMSERAMSRILPKPGAPHREPIGYEMLQAEAPVPSTSHHE